MGDFNAKVGEQREEKIVGPFGLDDRNESGEMLISFCKEQKLIIANTWFEQKRNARHTWRAPNGRAKNQIDFVLVSERYRNSVRNAKARPGADCGSDHNPVVVTLKCKLKKVQKGEKSHKRWNLEEIKQEESRNKYAEMTDDKLKQINQPEWKDIVKCTKEVADEICGSKIEYKQKWMKVNILEKMEERRKAKNQGRQREYQKLKREIQQMCRKAKEEHYNNLCKELEELDRQHNPRFHQKVKDFKGKSTSRSQSTTIKDKRGEVLFEKNQVLKRWAEYIKELYADQRTETPTNRETDYTTGIELNEITEEEIQEVIKKLPKRKACGADGIPAELLQSLGPEGIRTITNIINKIYRSGKIPDDFLKSKFIPLQKVKNTQLCEEHRLISLISHGSKILLHLIKSRITNIIDRRISECQLSYRKGKGTRDGIFILRTIGERMIQKNKKVYMVFIDYQKAFDRVNHERLIKILKEEGIPAHEIRLIENLYWNQKAYVSTKNGETEEVDILRGVRQGCILSPILFNLYTERMIEEALQEKRGIQINGESLTNIRYADDTVLLAENEQELKEMLEAVSQACKEYGMALNNKKTKSMIMGKGEIEKIKIKLEVLEIEQVHKYKYLGSWIYEDGRCLEEIKCRIGQAKMAFLENKELLRSNINITVKKKIIETYVFSILTYGSETWTLTKEAKRRINAFEIWCYRKMLKISWRRFMSNDKVLELVGEDRFFMKKIAERKFEFAGHILRGSSGSLMTRVLEGMIEGKRGVGRQRIMWLDDIKRWSGDGRYEQLKRKAEKKNIWRTMKANLRIEDGTNE